MKELLPPQYIIDQFNRDHSAGHIITDSVFLYWKGYLCSLLGENYGKRYSIRQLVERVKKELDKSDTKMFKAQAIKVLGI
jgi:HEPN domain-containing protein